MVKILGFPIQIRPGFIVFLLLIVFVNGVPLGAWLAGSVAVFTVAHELGHAVAARRTGARARISLDFLAGYASFTPSRTLSRTERATIALAGPLTQITLGIGTLLALGVDPFDHREFSADAHSLAIWWAGPMIGLFNLVPVMQLDGGNIAAEFVDALRPGRGRAIMTRLSVPLTAGALVGMALAWAAFIPHWARAAEAVPSDVFFRPPAVRAPLSNLLASAIGSAAFAYLLLRLLAGATLAGAADADTRPVDRRCSLNQKSRRSARPLRLRR